VCVAHLRSKKCFTQKRCPNHHSHKPVLIENPAERTEGIGAPTGYFCRRTRVQNLGQRSATVIEEIPEVRSISMQGTVRWYSNQGFGFIDPFGSTDGRAIYFHICDVKERAILKAGTVVTFDVIQVPKGPKCVNVQAAVVNTKEASPCPQTL
jgi:cold shock protein